MPPNCQATRASASPGAPAKERQRSVEKLNFYFDAVRRAGGEPVHLSLGLSEADLAKQAASLDAFVLPGSPADVDPARYFKPRHNQTKTLDADRDRTDSAILEYALANHKPVLAICYGCQILNVHQGGTLVQDIPVKSSAPRRTARPTLSPRPPAKIWSIARPSLRAVICENWLARLK
jgi:putative glutamine amidotransferase